MENSGDGIAITPLGILKNIRLYQIDRQDQVLPPGLMLQVEKGCGFGTTVGTCEVGGREDGNQKTRTFQRLLEVVSQGLVYELA